VAQLGRNAHGEVLEPGRVPDCYLGLRLHPPGHSEPAGVLVVEPASLLDPWVPQPDGTVLYALVTGHPDRTPRNWCSSPTSPWGCAPGPLTLGARSGSTRRRPPARSSAAGRTAASRAYGLVG
jgi:hypothetical protein